VWDVQTLQEFAKLSTKLTDGVFLFTGLELFESLSSKQLSTLLSHPWKICQQELDEEVDETEQQDEDGKFPSSTCCSVSLDKAETRLEETPDKAETRLEDVTQKQEHQDAEKTQTLHHVTESQKKSFETVSSFCEEMCEILNLDKNQLAENQADNLNRTVDPFDVTNLPHTMEVLRLKLTSHLKGLVEENQRQDPNYKPSGAHIQLHEHTFRLKDIRDGMTWYGRLVELSRHEKLLRQTLADQVCVCV
jgi:hypothetical protein